MEPQSWQWTSQWPAPELRLKITSFEANSSDEVISLYTIWHT